MTTTVQPVGTAILAEAEAAYKSVLVDAGAHRERAAAVVARARAARDDEALVVALRALAWAEHLGLRNAQARALLDGAARLAERRGLPERLVDVLVSRAAVSCELGRLRAAQQDLDRAGALAGPGSDAGIRLQQAVLHHNSGRLRDAAALYRRALAQPGCPLDVRVKATNNLAYLEVQRGRPTAALTLVDRAAALAEELGPAPYAVVAATRAWVTMQVGRLAQSLVQFDEAGALHVRAGLPLGEHYLEYADALLELRLLPEAGAAAARAAEELAHHGAHLMAAEAQLRVARLALLTGEAEAATAAARAAARVLRAQGRPSWVAQAEVLEVQALGLQGAVPARALARARAAAGALESLGLRAEAVEAHLTAGRAGLGHGRRAAALEHLARAERLARGATLLVRLRGALAAALAAEATGRPPDVLAACRSGLDDLARHRAALPSMELRARASGHGAELGRLGLRAALPSGVPAQVLDWMDRTRAASLFTVDTRPGGPVPQELLLLREAHSALEQARQDTGAAPPALVAEVAALEQRVRRASWAGTGPVRTTGGRTRPAELRRALDGRVLVTYGVLDGALLAVVLEPRRTRVVHLGAADVVSEQAQLLLFALRRLTRPRSPQAADAAVREAHRLLAALRSSLLAPLEVGPDTPLVVVPSNRLLRVPWSALHAAPVTVAPSAALWLRTTAAGPPGSSVALLAGPGLPGAVAEVRALSALHPTATVLLPPDTTVQAAAAALDGAGLAHLACHGRLRSDNPTFTALVLCDGPLTLHELVAHGIAPHRMVLAACDSGADTALEGDELLGFVSALLAGGTAGLVASTVVVPDLGTVPLMRDLHRQVLRGATLAEGLHAARARLDLSLPSGVVDWCAWNAFGAA